LKYVRLKAISQSLKADIVTSSISIDECLILAFSLLSAARDLAFDEILSPAN
jgi:hypothetical protein|tara:strand:- start:2085 stop:2240 length:156 start_codon:yes stop_codon:yes gene_type:complete